ncbi:transmembrane protein 45B-like [Haemaphysalis longicornis]
MGTFYGHVLPGVILFTLGTWWTYLVWRRHIVCQRSGTPFTTRASSGAIEGTAKILAAGMGFGSEIIKCIWKGRWEPHNWHHMCTYMFCGLSGPVDILLATGRAPLTPRDADYAALLISFVGEGLVLHVHTQGRPRLDVLVHELLVYVIVAQAACLCAEMVHRSSVVAALTRGYCAILQSTWLTQIAFILFDPREHKRWDLNSHHDSMMAAALFPVHMVAALMYVAVIGALLCRRGGIAYSPLPPPELGEKPHPPSQLSAQCSHRVAQLQ